MRADKCDRPARGADRRSAARNSRMPRIADPSRVIHQPLADHRLGDTCAIELHAEQRRVEVARRDVYSLEPVGWQRHGISQFHHTTAGQPLQAPQQASLLWLKDILPA